MAPARPGAAPRSVKTKREGAPDPCRSRTSPNPSDGWSHLAVAGTAAARRSSSISERSGQGGGGAAQQLRRSLNEGTKQTQVTEAEGTPPTRPCAPSLLLPVPLLFSLMFFSHLKSTDGRVALSLFFSCFNTLLCWRRFILKRRGFLVFLLLSVKLCQFCATAASLAVRRRGRPRRAVRHDQRRLDIRRRPGRP